MEYKNQKDLLIVSAEQMRFLTKEGVLIDVLSTTNFSLTTWNRYIFNKKILFYNIELVFNKRNIQ